MSLRACIPVIASLAVICTASAALAQNSGQRCRHAPAGNNLDRATALVVQGRYEEALELCNKLDSSQDPYDFFIVRSDAFNLLRQYENALRDCNSAIALNPGFVEAYEGRADCYNCMGQPAKALVDCNVALQLEPDNGSLYCNRGRAYFQLAKYAEAMSDLTRAIKLIPSLGQAHYVRGLVYEKIGNRKAAADERALSEKLGYQPGREAICDGQHVYRQ